MVTDSLTDCVGFKAFQPIRPNPILAKLMGIMRKHDMTNKKTKTKTMTNTFREHLQRAKKKENIKVMISTKSLCKASSLLEYD